MTSPITPSDPQTWVDTPGGRMQAAAQFYWNGTAWVPSTTGGTPPSETHIYTPGTTAVVAPAWAAGVFVSGVGSGGSGGGGQTTSGAGGGGGGSGAAVVDMFLPITAGGTLTVTIPAIALGGAIGSPGTVTAVASVAGFPSPFGSVLLQPGSAGLAGSAGAGGAGGAGGGVAGPAGGAAGAVGANGTAVGPLLNGGSGGGGGNTAGTPGGTGGSYIAYPFTRSTAAAVNGNGGPGGNSILGSGGNGGNAAAGAAATAPGGGGGGGAQNQAGGNGGPASVVLRFTA